MQSLSAPVGKTTASNAVTLTMRNSTRSAEIQSNSPAVLTTIHDAVTATSYSPSISAVGMHLHAKEVSYLTDLEPKTVPVTLVPRIVQALNEKKVAVTLRRGREEQLFAPGRSDKLRGETAIYKNLRILRFCRIGSGQVVMRALSPAFEHIADIAKQTSELSWMCVVSNRRKLEQADRMFGEQLGVRPRINSAFWDIQPYQTILTAKDSPLEIAHLHFHQAFVVDARCLLTASLREFSEQIQCPVLLFRRHNERYSDAEELLLERVAGPIIWHECLQPEARTVVLRLKNPSYVAGLMNCASESDFLKFRKRLLPAVGSVVHDLLGAECEVSSKFTFVKSGVSSSAKASRVRNTEALSPDRAVKIVSLESVVLTGIPDGIVVFAQGTSGWLKQKSGRLSYRGDGVRFLVDPYATSNARYEQRGVSIVDLEI